MTEEQKMAFEQKRAAERAQEDHQRERLAQAALDAQRAQEQRAL